MYVGTNQNCEYSLDITYTGMQIIVRKFKQSKKVLWNIESRFSETTDLKLGSINLDLCLFEYKVSFIRHIQNVDSRIKNTDERMSMGLG